MTWLQVLVPVASALFAAGGAWAAVRTELYYLRRDLDKLEVRVNVLEHVKRRA